MAAAIVSSAIAGTALPAVAHAEVTTLHVNNGVTQCSDSGTGTEVQPYCTVQAAADDAQPGQTVRIVGIYSEQVTVRNSGTNDKPITFEGPVTSAVLPTGRVLGDTNAGTTERAHAFVLSDVDNIVIRNLYLKAPQEAVVVKDADRVVLDHTYVVSAGSTSQVFPTPAPGIRLGGNTTGTTISRSRIFNSGAAGVAIDAGVTGTVITTNLLLGNKAGGVVVTDAPGTVVTSNTVTRNCQSGVTLTGTSRGSAVMNNIITQTNYGCSGTSGVDLLVSPESTDGTRADYNVLYPYPNVVNYSWGGSTYNSAPDFTARTGQGGNDLAVNPNFGNGLTFYSDSAVMDSADETAPGQLDTDINGNPRVDHPLVPNTGKGAGYHDRGAAEHQNPLTPSLYASISGEAGRPLDVTVNAEVTAPWYPATLALDFGDGTAPVVPPAGPLSHTYEPGTYTLKLTATDTSGLARTATRTVTVNPVGPLETSLRVAVVPWEPAVVQAYPHYPKSPWPVSSYTFDFGDGTPPVVRTEPDGVQHRYQYPGQYLARLAIADDHGRTVTADSGVRVNFAMPLDLPVAGRWGVGKPATNGMFNAGTWSMRAGVGGEADVAKVWFGQANDLPALGDWDRVGHEQLGVYRNGLFALRHADGSVSTTTFGERGDIPVPGFWDNSGHSQLAIYRRDTATFAVRHDDGSVSTATFGSPGDVPIVGDWDGVGHTQMGIYRDGLFALRHDDGSVSTAYFGMRGDLPIVGDWLGKGRTSFGIYRPREATYALSNAYGNTGNYTNQLY